MVKIVTVEKMRIIEAAADKAGISYARMMQNAGKVTAYRTIEMLSHLSDARITILVGKGNNGGDGLVAGYKIANQSNIQVRFYLLNRRDESDENFTRVQEKDLFIAYAENDADQRVLQNMIASSDLVMDAIFGIGIRLPIREDIAKILRTVNRVIQQQNSQILEQPYTQPAHPSAKPERRIQVLAVDCPSGLDCDTGQLDSNAIYANETITFIAGKYGLFTFPGADTVGKLSISTIGVPEDLSELKTETDFLVDASYVRQHLPERPLNSSKTSFGKALIIAGSKNYVGAPGLCSQSAYRAGSGLVSIASPEPIISILATRSLEPTWLPLAHEDGAIAESALPIIQEKIEGYQAVLLGPGLGLASTTQQFLEQFFIVADLPPIVVDADGLNLLSNIEKWWELLPANTIITPHLREMSRLSGITVNNIEANRLEIAREKAQEWNVILLLKGAHTIIATPDGALAILPFKTDALATAGSGDVLAGIIVGLLSQQPSAIEATIIGGYLHGLSGQLAGEALTNRSVIASDIIDFLPEALHLI